MISYLICQALLIWLNLHIRSFPIHKLLKAKFKQLVQSPGQDQGPLILPQNLKYIYKTPYSPQCNSFNNFVLKLHLMQRQGTNNASTSKFYFSKKTKKKPHRFWSLHRHSNRITGQSLILHWFQNLTSSLPPQIHYLLCIEGWNK